MKKEFNNRDHHYQAVDREKTCPFLLRMFYKENSRHMLEDFTGNKVPEKDEI
jgi:Sin3 associated polypeptide p18 (SAP18)